MWSSLAKVLGVAVALSSAGCIGNYSIKRFDPIPTKKSHANTIEEELVVHVLGTEHKTGAGFTSDHRGPHTVHTRYVTRDVYHSYSIARMTVSCEKFKETLIAPSDQMTTIPTLRTEGYSAGTYHGEINTARSFDYVPSDRSNLLTVRIEGSIRIGNTSRPFVTTRKFRYEVIRKVWLITFDDLMSI